jgi:two-component system sensor histidine kinase RegB
VLELDPTLGQALENLLNNAADTGTEKVALKVRWNGEEASISVRDWGPGIPAEMLEQMGKPIIHADRSGLGIGLMLSQASVERHGGRIELRNLREGGTLATLTLPLQRRQGRSP